MSVFLRLLNERDKAAALLEVCSQQRAAGADARIFEVPPQAFDAVPGKPFAYWVSEAVREIGMFGNQNTVCRPTTPKWRWTIERLKQRFPRFDEMSATEVASMP